VVELADTIGLNPIAVTACGFESHPGHLADLSVRLQPRARRDEVVGERAGAIVVRVTAPPVDGRANAALCALVAKAAGVAPSRVRVVRGHTARDKVVRVEGVEESALRRALNL
jgi:uncharacterized protein (TIGR00251 family)